MTNPNTKYTDLTQSKRLKEIGFDAEADGYWSYGKFKEQVYFQTEKEFKSYRLDTLLLALPEWCFGFADRYDSTTDIGSRFFDQLHIHFGTVSFNPDVQSWDKEERVEGILFDLFTTRGSQAIAAAVDLICLLKEVEANKTD